MIAVKRLQSLFWVLLVALGALSAYLVSLKVATERNELNRVRTQIAAARGDIRYLETEFSARANMRQLEKWNADDFRYSTPTADRYLSGERELAHLGGLQSNGPAYVAPPVMVAMVETSRDLPSASNAASTSPATSQIRSDDAVIRTAQAKDSNSAAAPVASMAVAAHSAQARIPAAVSRNAGAGESSLARTTERMAMMDARLLDDGTLGDIGRRAAAEKRRGRD